MKIGINYQNPNRNSALNFKCLRKIGNPSSEQMSFINKYIKPNLNGSLIEHLNKAGDALIIAEENQKNLVKLWFKTNEGKFSLYPVRKVFNINTFSQEKAEKLTKEFNKELEWLYF